MLIFEAVIELYVSRPLIQTVAATQSSQSLIASEISPNGMCQLGLVQPVLKSDALFTSVPQQPFALEVAEVLE
jgi:hypothetical protein